MRTGEGIAESSKPAEKLSRPRRPVTPEVSSLQYARDRVESTAAAVTLMRHGFIARRFIAIAPLPPPTPWRRCCPCASVHVLL